MQTSLSESRCHNIYLQECLFRRESLYRLDLWRVLEVVGNQYKVTNLHEALQIATGAPPLSTVDLKSELLLSKH